MIDNTLNVEVSASVEGLKKGLTQAESSIKGFTSQADKMTTKTNRMAKSVKVNAVPAMTSFSQVIQDAPFGIRGVANNITQLTAQLGYLSRGAGGTGAALKAMVSTLVGPAGILLAVSVVTSLLVSYGDELANIGSETSRTIEKQKQLVESLESTSSVLKSQIGAIDAQLKLLNLQGVSTQELLDKKLKVLETELATLVLKKQTLKNQIASTRLLTTELSLWQKISNVIAVSTGNLGGQKFINEDAIKDVSELESAFSDTEAAIFKTILSIGKIKEPNIFDPKKTEDNFSSFKNSLDKRFTNQVKAFEKELTTEAKFQQKIQEQLNEHLNETEIAEIESEDRRIKMLQKKQIERQNVIFKGNALEKALYDKFIELRRDQILTFAEWKSTQEGLETEKSIANLVKFNEKANEIIQGGIFQTFQGLGLAIGNAFATGGNVLKAAGSAIIGALGDILIQFGSLTLAAGIASTALGQALKNPWNPGSGAAAIAAGIALIAIGGAVKAFSSNLGGGGDTSSDFSSSGSSNSGFSGSSSSFSSGGSGGGTVVFEIAGTKLVGVLKNTLDRNRALGGSLSIT